MSRLLYIQWVERGPRWVHGRRPDRPAPRPAAPPGAREGPCWNAAPAGPGQPAPARTDEERKA
jgi:hypothetical protein